MDRFRPDPRSLTAIATLVLLACSADGGAGSATGERSSDLARNEVAIRDSAGITIVEGGPLPAPGDGPEWSLSAEPSLTIGVLEGPEPLQLYQVTDAARLSDGRIVIGNGGSGQLRFFDSEGRFLRAAGTEGNGPGEFVALNSVEVAAGDMLHVSDFRVPRITVFDARGTLVRTVPFEPSAAGGRSYYRGRLDSGDYLRGFPVITDRPPDGGLFQDSLEYHRYNPDGKHLGTIVTLPQQPTYTIHRDGENGMRTLFFPRPFDVEGSSAAGDGLYVGTGETYEVRTLAPDGTIVRILRRAVTPIELDDALATDLEEAWKDTPYGKHWASVSDEPLDKSNRPASLPLFDQLLLGRDGSLWIRRFPMPADEVRWWDIHDSRGHDVARIAIPEDVEVFEAGADYVLGMRRTELGIEQVVLYDILRPEDAAE